MTEEKPAANGYTKTLRRIMAAASGLSFFGLLFAQVLGFLKQDVPFAIYLMLFSGGLMMFDGFNELVKKIGVPNK